MKDAKTPEQVFGELRTLANKRLGIDWALNDHAYTNSVILARGLLMILDEIQKVKSVE